ncbi:hypothetical protein CA267_003830 [Alteromonas pelagimontana]|uniref:HEPN AbiU2-like domain-containing protein n=1 Tax=Alteromonas pelagimontana TaxID=1858656 RepID=A0A6M4MBI8_9ALTE|nr:hypothetical protein [Alteromonas pelagimontana]QJR79970.1 hypothetical protein CA267_003830 [Alteromonas pelagimontana]
MKDDHKGFSTTSSWEEFSKRTGIPLPSTPKIDRSLFSDSEIKCFESYFVSLCTDLTIYNQLFGTDESISVLNEFNGFVFKRIQRSFLEKICLKISCLMDPAKAGSNDNLSLLRFVEKAGSPELSAVYDKLYKDYESTGIKIWRNKVLAHTDLKTVMGKFEFKLKLDADNINRMVRDMQDLIDLIKDPRVYTDTEVTLPFGSDGNSFVSRLRKINSENNA